MIFHFAEDAADQDVGEGGVVHAQHQQRREEAFAPPDRHADAGGGSQESVGGAGHGVGVEHVLPDDSQCPLGHDVGEDEDGTQILFPCQVRAGHQESHDAAEEDGDDAGSYCQPDRVDKRRPQVGLRQFGGEEVNAVHQGVARSLSREMRIDGTGMDLEGILDDGDDRGEGREGEDDTHQNKDHVMRLGEVGPDLIPADRSCVHFNGRSLCHKALLFS